MSYPVRSKALYDKTVARIPEVAELSASQKIRLEGALTQLSTALFLYPATTEGDSQRRNLDTKMGYARLTIESLTALSVAKVVGAAEEAVKEVFLSGVAEALSSLR